MTTSSLPPNYAGWIEQPSAANTTTPPQYRYNHTIETPRGHLLEMDDTPGRERIRLTHRANTFIELAPDGNGTFKIFGTGYQLVLGDYNISVGIDDGNLAHNLNMNVYGDLNLHVFGDTVETYEGNLEQHVMGNFTQTVEGITSMVCNQDMHIGGGYGDNGGSVTIETADHVYISGDVAVEGEATALKITSMTRVDAVTGVSAGPLGFTSMEGGLTLGPPAVATPGCVIASGFGSFLGPVTSAASMAAPIATFGTMTAVLMEDHVNTLIYNTHIHPVAYGPTGVPIQSMVSV
jgi:hypothetical protein